LKSIIKKFIILILLIFIVGCDFLSSSKDLKAKRAAEAKKNKKEILIGAVAPWKKVTHKGNLNWYGIKLALKEINSKGGILGRKVKIIKKDDEASINKGIEIAQELSENVNVIAVIGHAYSFISIPASVIYEFNGVVMIAPSSSSPKLTQRNFKFVFRVVPNDNDMGAQLATYASRVGYKRMMIYYIKGPYGLTLANAFEKKAQELGIEILDRLSYDATTKARVFYNDFSEWQENYLFDAVFLVARGPDEGAKIIKQARKAGVKVPFIGGDSLNSPLLIEVGGKAVEGTVVPAYFNPLDKRKVVQNFIKNFKTSFHKMPDTWAALYYDAAKILFYAIKKAGTPVPEKIAETLHNMKNFEGVTGKITFTKSGDVVGKKIFIKKVINGKFIYIQN